MEVRSSLARRFLQREPSVALPCQIDEIARTIRTKGHDQCGDRVDSQLELAPGLRQVGLAPSQRFFRELETFDVAMRRSNRVPAAIAGQSPADEAPAASALRCR